MKKKCARRWRSAEAHEDRNLARALTPAERKEKKLRKMFQETGGGTGETHVRVYRIESLRNPKHKFRVDINAQENRLTGAFHSLLFFFFFFATFSRRGFGFFAKRVAPPSVTRDP